VIDFDKHVHKPEEIATVKIIEDIEMRWNELNASYGAITQEARERCKPIKNLLTFIDGISQESPSLKPSKQIEEDYNLLTKNSKDIEVHMTTLTDLAKEKNQEKLKNFDKSYAALKDVIPRFDYLKTLSELDVFKAYKAAIQHDSEKPFPATLNHENREMYYRLKFRALNSNRQEDTSKINLNLVTLQQTSTELCLSAITHKYVEIPLQFNKTKDIIKEL
jgi:hypothetical protein